MITKMNITVLGITLVALFGSVNWVVVAAPSVNTTTENILETNTTSFTPTELVQCQHPLTRPKGLLDYKFWKKFFKHWIPFTSKPRVKMQFYLFKRDFPDCGKELFLGDDELLANSDFDARHPTRIIVHGWMSQAHGSLNRDVKNAYLSLTHGESPLYPDFNVIVCDWSMISSNVNYFGVADMIEDLGFLLAEFVRHLHMRADLQYDDIYIIGHSLGAQIAGSAGKQIKPYRFNTIFALDPAGPKFREQNDDYRIDASDAHYVESIQTSVTFGFEQPVGHATFYPNYGKNQKNCYVYGCSHKRAHHYFAESITSSKGFWGTRCERLPNEVWILLDNEGEYRMGGEPSVQKNGTFYVKTYAEPPFAMGRRQDVEEEAQKRGDKMGRKKESVEL